MYILVNALGCFVELYQPDESTKSRQNQRIPISHAFLGTDHLGSFTGKMILYIRNWQTNSCYNRQRFDTNEKIICFHFFQNQLNIYEIFTAKQEKLLSCLIVPEFSAQHWNQKYYLLRRTKQSGFTRWHFSWSRSPGPLMWET